MIKAQIESRRATDAMWELQRATGKPIAEIMKSEVQAILQVAMDRTRAASIKKLKAAIERRVTRTLRGRTPKDAKVSINIKQHPGRAWYIDPTGHIKKRMTDGHYRWSDEDYQDYLQADIEGTSSGAAAKVQSILRKEMTEFRKRRGLAKQTWLLLARQLGITLRAPAYVQKAATPGVNNATNVSGRVQSTPTRVVYEGRNSSPAANSYGARGKAAIQSAIRNRQALIRKAIEGGMSHAAQAVRRKYGLR